MYMRRQKSGRKAVSGKNEFDIPLMRIRHTGDDLDWFERRIGPRLPDS